MRRYIAGAVFLTMLVVSAAFSQNGQLGGSVSDATGALIPGVTITATNTATGVMTTTLTNESGTYTFPSLQIGVYRVSAELSGFQTSTANNLELGPVAVRQNFQLKVGTAQSLEVVSEPLTALSQTSPTVGNVLDQEKISNLPNVGNNVLNLLNTLPGLRMSTSSGPGLMGPQLATINGLDMNSVNVTRDGLTMNDTHFNAAGDVTAGVSIPHGGGTGVMSATTINPDLVGEIRLILSPIDAELGRGNSQIQVQTRSGTNQYRGAAVWNNINTAMNANSWSNNRTLDPISHKAVTPDYRNVNEYTLSYGGPIVKNKTFFYALWDQNISALRQTIYAHVLTDQARQGIFRFWEGWVGRSADPTNNPTSFATAAASANPTIASVDLTGKPVSPAFWPDGTPYTGRLVCFSVFGTVKTDGSPFTGADCPGGVDSTGRAFTGVAMTPAGSNSWDPKRPSTFDQRGYFSKLLAVMPHANNFFNTNGDGLNMGVQQWLLRQRIGDPTFYNETLIGNDPYSNRKQINVKIDQNFKNHRINGSWSYQHDDNLVLPGQWPGGVGGYSYRRPQIFNLGVTSTISPTLLNEARFGYHINKGSQIPAWESSDSSVRDAIAPFIAQGGVRPGSQKTYPVLVRPLSGCAVFGTGADELVFDSGITGMRLNCGSVPGLNGAVIPNLLNDPLYEYIDTISWTHGKHAFKFGGDLRFPRTDGYAFQPYVNAPYGNLGGTLTQSPLVSDTAGTGTPSLGAVTGTSGNIFRQQSRTWAANLAYLLTDSIGPGLNTPYWIDSLANKDAGITGWQDITTEKNRFRSTKSSDYAFFAKDDFKITKNLTLNLGLRYEYYSPPFLTNGLTVTSAGLGDGMFGASRGAGGKLFDNWLAPGNLYLANYGNATALKGATPLDCKTGVSQAPGIPTSNCDPNTLTTVQFVGAGTKFPDTSVIPSRHTNFGPAIGFAWQLPWFGEGKTTLRGGYSIQYQRIGVRDDILSPPIGNTLTQFAASTDPDIAAIIATRAVRMTDLPALVPRLPQVPPGLNTPVYAKSTSFTAYDPNLSTPYVENLTLSVTRSISRNQTLDVRYIGTLSRKGLGSMDLNASTVYYNPELFHALEVTRAGGNDPLFDQMFAGLRLSGVPGTVPLVDGVTSRGSDQLRQSTATRANLANGNFVAVANALITPATLSIAAGGSGITGLSPAPAFSILHNGCDRLADGLTSIPTRCFPENYLSANPQLNGATYIGNLARSNYHGFQVSYTLRPTNGFSVQTTYSLAKSMQLGGGGGPGIADAGSTGATAYTDPLQRNLDRVQGLDVRHSMRTNGTLELPIGPNKLLFANSHGLVGRLIEKWQTSLILNLNSGQPISIGGAGQMRYGNPRYNVTQYWQKPDGNVVWDGGTNGTYFGDKYVTQRDPQCLDTSVVAGSLAAFCTLNALGLKNTDGTIVPALVNPRPGEIGTLGNRNIYSFGTWFLDGNIQKSFRLTETKALSLRVDATNILNHPQLSSPNFTVGATQLGLITGKGTTIFGQATPVQRNFQAQLRLSF